jgi:hypothetical protein
LPSNELLTIALTVALIINTVGRWTGKKDTESKDIENLRGWKHEIDNWRQSLFYSYSRSFVSRNEYESQIKNLWAAIDRERDK